MRGKAGGLGANRKKFWNIQYRNASTAFLAVSSQNTGAAGIAIGDNGTKLYMVGNSTAAIYQYTLGTPGELSGAVYANKSINLTSIFQFSQGLDFKADGTKMYVCGEDLVAEFNLSTAWDVSTASLGVTLSVDGQYGALQAIKIKPDGSKMFTVSNSSDTVAEYAVSSAWSMSSASFSQAFDISAQLTAPGGVVFHPNGKNFLCCGNSNDVFEYALAAPWDISSASFVESHGYFSASPQALVSSICVDNQGAQLYLLADLQSSSGPASRVYQYDIK